MNQGKWEFCKLSDPAMISLLCNIACVEIYTTIGVPRWLISIQALCHRSVRPVDISRVIFACSVWPIIAPIFMNTIYIIM